MTVQDPADPALSSLPPTRKRIKALRQLLLLLVIWLGTGLALGLAAMSGIAAEARLEATAEEAVLPLKASTRLEQLELRREGDRVEFQLPAADGAKWVSADEFARQLEARQKQDRRASWVLRLLNISGWGGVLWVSIGLTGQILFTGRMLVQWLVSEKAKQSIIPTTFWWMSLSGATMLVIYFLWRRDIVGVLGQTTGWLIYLRNLWMIYRKPTSA